MDEIANEVKPIVRFSDDELKVVKRRSKSARTVCSSRLGIINFEVERGTTSSGKSIVPEEFSSFVPKGKRFSYDLIWSVTKMHFVDNMQRLEIQKALPFHVSTGSISNIYTDGLAMFRACHEAASDELKNYYRNGDSPFIIQIDGTNEGGDSCLFQVRDSRTGNVVLSRKIPTENQADLKKILSEIEATYGRPLGVICDMSPIILAAITSLWGTNVPIFICQFHFLRDVGKDLLIDLHEALRKSITASGISSNLKLLRQRLVNNLSKESETNKQNLERAIDMIDWVCDYKNDLNGLGTPFDLSWKCYYDRCNVMHNHITEMKDENSQLTGFAHQVLNRVRKQLKRVIEKSSVKSNYNRLGKMYDLFNEMREIFTPCADTSSENEETSSERKSPLSREETASAIQTRAIDKKIGDIIKKLEAMDEKGKKKVKVGRKKTNKKSKYKKAAEQFEKYRHQLSNHITVDGKVYILPRTNNLCELSFRELKRKMRRTTGKKNLSYLLDRTPAEIMFLQNLEDKEYCEIIFQGEEIHEAFAKIPMERIKEIRQEMKSRHIKHKDLKVIRNQDFLQENQKSFQKASA